MDANVNRTVWNKIAFAMLCTLVVLTVIPYGTVHPPIIAIFYLFTAITVVVAAVDGILNGSVRLSLSLFQLPLLLAVIFAAVQVIPFGAVADISGLGAVPSTISKDPYWTMVFALHVLALGTVLSLALASLNSARRIQKVTVLITVFGFAFAFFAIIQSFLSPAKIYGVYEAAFAKPFGTFVNRHNFAAYMEMAIAIPLGLLLQGSVKKDKRLLYATTVVLMAVALLMSGSRGGLVALGAQVVVLLLFMRGKLMRGRVWLKAVLGLVLVSVIVAGAALIGGETSMSRISETAGSEDFSTKRTLIWGVTMDVIKSNLPLGAGFGAFGVAYTQSDSQNGLERVEQSHNDYLQLLADAGLVGALIGIIFLIALVRSVRNIAKIENVFRRGVAVGALTGVFGVLVHSLFDFVLHTTAVTVLFLMLLALLNSAEESYADDFGENRRLAPEPAPGNVTRIEEMKRVN